MEEVKRKRKHSVQWRVPVGAQVMSFCGDAEDGRTWGEITTSEKRGERKKGKVDYSLPLQYRDLFSWPLF